MWQICESVATTFLKVRKLSWQQRDTWYILQGKCLSRGSCQHFYFPAKYKIWFLKISHTSEHFPATFLQKEKKYFFEISQTLLLGHLPCASLPIPNKVGPIITSSLRFNFFCCLAPLLVWVATFWFSLTQSLILTWDHYCSSAAWFHTMSQDILVSLNYYY